MLIKLVYAKDFYNLCTIHTFTVRHSTITIQLYEIWEHRTLFIWTKF